MRRESIVEGPISSNLLPDPFLVSRKSSQVSNQSKQILPHCVRDRNRGRSGMYITADDTCMTHDGAETESVGIQEVRRPMRTGVDVSIGILFGGFGQVIA
jgi:hypothetical protein